MKRFFVSFYFQKFLFLQMINSKVQFELKAEKLKRTFSLYFFLVLKKGKCSVLYV